MQGVSEQESLLGGIDEAIAVTEAVPGRGRTGPGSPGRDQLEVRLCARQTGRPARDGDERSRATTACSPTSIRSTSGRSRGSRIMRNVAVLWAAANGKPIFSSPPVTTTGSGRPADDGSSHVAGRDRRCRPTRRRRGWGGLGDRHVPNGLIAADGCDTVRAATCSPALPPRVNVTLATRQQFHGDRRSDVAARSATPMERASDPARTCRPLAERRNRRVQPTASTSGWSRGARDARHASTTRADRRPAAASPPRGSQ